MATPKSSSVTRLKTPATARSTDFNGTIQGTALEAALDEQREAAWEIEAVLRMAAIAINEAIDSAELDAPNYFLALRRAADRARKLADDLEGSVLEHRAIEIAQAREADAQGGAA